MKWHVWEWTIWNKNTNRNQKVQTGNEFIYKKTLLIVRYSLSRFFRTLFLFLTPVFFFVFLLYFSFFTFLFTFFSNFFSPNSSVDQQTNSLKTQEFFYSKWGELFVFFLLWTINTYNTYKYFRMSLRSASDLTLLSNANQRESMSKVGTSRRKLMFQRSMWVTHFNVQQQMCTMDYTVYDTLVCF